jgi:hypothetical protein
MSLAERLLPPYAGLMTKLRFVLLLAPFALASCAPPPSVRDAFRPGTEPSIDSVELRPTGPVVYADLHYHSADGNVVAIHRDIVSSDAAEPLHVLSDTRVDADPELQKKGALFTDRYPCGADHYHAVIRAYLIDSNHNHSNTLDYQINCAD